MSASTLLNIEHLRSWIGREESVSDVISVDLVKRFNATFDLSEEAPSIGDDAPLQIGYCMAQPTAPTSLLGEDGHPQRGGFFPPVPLPRRMWAGSTIIFHGGLRVGDTIRRVSRIADVVVKEGSSGTLCFVTVQHKVDVDGSLRIEETQNIVYRDAAGPQDAVKLAARDPAPAGEHRRATAISTPLLFRYSALTFNGHRIHYDRPYAVEVEYYPGLVVHGPLQATLLLNYAAELKGRAPSKFMFRGLSPLFDDDKVNLHATAVDSDTIKLWTARENGPVAMSAEASWS